jgi:hypothetical protein
MTWIDAAPDAQCMENTDERGWRFAPHGWLAMQASLAAAHTAQLPNYLSASRLPVGLLMNFGTRRLQWRRLIR